MYDITQDYPPLTYPKPAIIDIPALKSLLLDASKEAAELAKIVRVIRRRTSRRKSSRSRL